ncbi:MAG: hypothetical protein LCH93_18525 [Proteobacteria bacterium]|nr:hypothetical protein [Pseudomonadota bacterium]
MRHGRLRQPDRLCGTLDAAEFGDPDKHLQMANARAGDQTVAKGGGVGAQDIQDAYRSAIYSISYLFLFADDLNC